MNLVDRDGRRTRLCRRAARHPSIVAPCRLATPVDDRCRTRRLFRMERIRIRLQWQQRALAALDLEFVERALRDVRHEQLPHAALVPLAHRQAPAVPTAKVADDACAPG